MILRSRRAFVVAVVSRPSLLGPRSASRMSSTARPTLPACKTVRERRLLS